MTIGTLSILLAAGTHFYKTANFKMAYYFTGFPGPIQ